MTRFTHRAAAVAVPLVLALPASAAAQAPTHAPTQAPAPAAAPVAAPVAIDSTAVIAGTRVRILMRDTTTLLGRTRRVGSTGVVEGTLVALRPADVTVRIARGYNPNDYTDFTIPFDNMQALERRVAAGPCQRGGAARLLCVAGGTALGGAVGYAAGRQIGGVIGSDSDPVTRADSQNKYAARGVLLGAVVGALVANSLGRHRWAPLWTNPRAEP
jgi:hypothetical protein